MPTIIATDRDGAEHRIAADTDLSAMRNLKDEGGLDIMALCGGCCACATCHVYVDEAWVGQLPPAELEERELLQDSPNYRPGVSRLSCQIAVTDAMDGLRLTLAPLD